MTEDVRYALRQMRKASGVRRSCHRHARAGHRRRRAMFGLIQGVLLSPRPTRHRIDWCWCRRDGRRPALHPGHVVRAVDPVASESRTLEPPALYRWTFNFLVLPDGSHSLGGMVVTRNFFSTLGVKPLIGRELTEAEASRPKVPATGIMLGYELWQRQFKGDPAVVGTATASAATRRRSRLSA